MVNLVHVKNSNSQKDKGNKKEYMNHITVEELIKAGASLLTGRLTGLIANFIFIAF